MLYFHISYLTSQFLYIHILFEFCKDFYNLLRGFPSLRTVSFGQRLTAAHNVCLTRSMRTVSYGQRLTRPGFHNRKVHPSLRTVSFGQRLTAAHQVRLTRSMRTVSYGQRLTRSGEAQSNYIINLYMVCVSIIAYSLLRTTSYSSASSASYAIYAYSLLRTTSYKIWITHSLFFKSFNILLHIFHFFKNTFSNLSISPTLYIYEFQSYRELPTRQPFPFSIIIIIILLYSKFQYILTNTTSPIQI